MQDREVPAPIRNNEIKIQLPAMAIEPSAQRAGLQIQTLQDVEYIAKLAAASGFFKDVNDMAKGAMKIMFGLEMGLSPLESLNGLYVINGRVSLYADTIAERMDRGGAEVVLEELTKTKAVGHLKDKATGEKIGESVTFDIEMAASVRNKDTWKNDPESQLYARLVTRLHKRHGRKYFNHAVQSYEEMFDVVGVPKADDAIQEVFNQAGKVKASRSTKQTAKAAIEEKIEAAKATVEECQPAPEVPVMPTREQKDAFKIVVSGSGWTGPQLCALIHHKYGYTPQEIPSKLTLVEQQVTQEWIETHAPGVLE